MKTLFYIDNTLRVKDVEYSTINNKNTNLQERINHLFQEFIENTIKSKTLSDLNKALKETAIRITSETIKYKKENKIEALSEEDSLKVNKIREKIKNEYDDIKNNLLSSEKIKFQDAQSNKNNKQRK